MGGVRRFEIAGLIFEIPRGVYPPAEDTEMLVEALLERDLSGLRVLDVGTGCGVLGILAAARGAARVIGTDVNPAAVRAAEANAEAAGLRGVFEARLGDLISPVRGEEFDLVVANPPYLPEEPTNLESSAWAGGGPRGRDFLDRLIANIPEVLADGGRAIVLQSAVNGLEETAEVLTAVGLSGRVILRRRLPFEELFLWEITWKAP